jgi:DNA-binding response OmpR family regulator
MRQGISKTLRSKGSSALRQATGSAALDVIRAHKDHIDVLLLDITLPGASSCDVHHEARR